MNPSSDHFPTDPVLPPSDHCCIERAGPSSDHYCIDIVVPSSDHCCTETVPPSSNHYGTMKVALKLGFHRYGCGMPIRMRVADASCVLFDSMCAECRAFHLTFSQTTCI